MVMRCIGNWKIMNSWNSVPNREQTVDELDNIFRTYGNPLQKSSKEIENQLFLKSRNQEEYSTLAQRLLRHMRDMAIKCFSGSHQQERRQIPPPTIRPIFYVGESSRSPDVGRSTRFPFPPTVIEGRAEETVSVLSRSVFPPSFVAGPPHLISAVPEPSSTPREVSYGSVRLPAPNKRTYATVTSGPYRITPNYQRVESISRPDDVPEIITRLIRDEDDERSSDPNTALSSETYETSFRFLVPRNAVIKQITIHLKKTR